MRINSYQLSRFDQVDQIDGQQTGCIAEMYFFKFTSLKYNWSIADHQLMYLVVHTQQ